MWASLKYIFYSAAYPNLFFCFFRWNQGPDLPHSLSSVIQTASGKQTSDPSTPLYHLNFQTRLFKLLTHHSNHQGRQSELQTHYFKLQTRQLKPCGLQVNFSVHIGLHKSGIYQNPLTSTEGKVVDGKILCHCSFFLRTLLNPTRYWSLKIGTLISLYMKNGGLEFII